MRVERVLLLFILLISIFFGFQCGKNRAIPNNLIGVWETSDPKYSDRTFEITRNEIIFQTGENDLRYLFYRKHRNGKSARRTKPLIHYHLQERRRTRIQVLLLL